MRRKLLLSVLFLILSSLLASCAQESGARVEQATTVDKYSGGPRLALDSKLYDYGSVPFLKEVSASFTVTNKGDQPLIIKGVDVKTLEGC